MTSETLLYFVTIRDRKGGETRYRIKKTAKMGKMSALYLRQPEFYDSSRPAIPLQRRAYWREPDAKTVES